MCKLADRIDRQALAQARWQLRAKRIRDYQERTRRQNDAFYWVQFVSVALLCTFAVVVFFDALEKAMW